VVSLVLWHISLQERQEYVRSVFAEATWPTSVMAVEGMETGYTGRVLMQGRWRGSGEPFHGTDVVTHSPRGGTRSRMVVEAGVEGHGVWYLWRWRVNLELNSLRYKYWTKSTRSETEELSVYHV